MFDFIRNRINAWIDRREERAAILRDIRDHAENDAMSVTRWHTQPVDEAAMMQYSPEFLSDSALAGIPQHDVVGIQELSRARLAQVRDLVSGEQNDRFGSYPHED